MLLIDCRYVMKRLRFRRRFFCRSIFFYSKRFFEYEIILSGFTTILRIAYLPSVANMYFGSRERFGLCLAL